MEQETDLRCDQCDKPINNFGVSIKRQVALLEGERIFHNVNLCKHCFKIELLVEE